MLNSLIRRSFYHSLRLDHSFVARSYSSLPRIASPSFWQSLIPKPLRNRNSNQVQQKAIEPKPWNPATFFIVIFLVIGSNAVNLLAVKKDYISFSRQADAKIAALKEAIERLQRGEDVDVKRLLGTGDQTAEKEWEDVLKELQQERSSQDTKASRRAARNAEKRDAELAKADTQKTVSQEDEQNDWTQPNTGEQKTRKVDFY